VPDPTSCSPTGEPWFTHAVGSGHLWPLLTGERAEQDLQSGDGDAASGLAVDFQRMTWSLEYVPEQVWEDPDTPASPFGADPTTASIGFRNGKAAGSAAPLVWGQAQYLRLVLDLQAGTVLDQPQITRARYLDPAAPADVPVTITSPANGATVTGATTNVTGTTTPGARVDVGAGQPESSANTSTVVATVADSHGAYTATIPTPSGTTIITAAAAVGAHATGWAQESVTG
jgi:glucoamylase